MHLAHHQELCRLHTEILPRGGGGGRIWAMEKRGGRKLTIVLCEAQGATPYTCYAGMLVWLKKFVVSLF